jgi:hypothetical protein
MSLPDITPDQLINAIQNVPPERWGEALRAIERLQGSAAESKHTGPSIKTGTDLRDSPLIGIWADRTDIPDNHAFARELRRQAEQRK